MKRIKIIPLIMSAFLSFSFCSCARVENNADEVTGTIFFKSNGGSSVESITQAAGTAVSEPQPPEKTGYAFSGWYLDSRKFTSKFTFGVMPEGNTVLFAKWELVTYTIDYNYNGGAPVGNPSEYTVNRSDFTLAEPTRDDFSFGGWYEDGEFNTKIDSIVTSSAKNYTLYAKWISNSTPFTITYHLDGGTNSGDNPAEYSVKGGDVSLKPATRDGYDFVGWYTDSEYKNRVDSVSVGNIANVELYARWTLKKYKINYHLDLGTNGNNPSFYTIETDNIALDAPTKVGCTFRGWYADSEFTQPITVIDTSAKSPVDVYAKWIDFIQERVYEFDFGLSKTYTLFQISDVHTATPVSDSQIKGEADWINSKRQDFAASFGEPLNADVLPDSSFGCLDAFIDHINAEKPDGVLFTGDLVDYLSAATVKTLTGKLALIDQTVPYKYIMGNHEGPLSFLPRIPNGDATDFAVLDLGEFEVVTFDNSQKYISAKQYDRLLAEVQKDKPIIIACHVPFMTMYNCSSRLEDCGNYYFIDYYSTDSTTQRAMDLILNSDNVKAVICGHIHGETLTYLAENKPQITCSSGLTGRFNKIIVK